MPKHPIQYNVILGNRPSKVMDITVTEDFQNMRLLEIGFLPESFEHLVMGIDYSADKMNLGVGAGYFTVFVYTENLQSFINGPECLPELFHVYIILTHDKACVDSIAGFLKNNGILNSDKALIWIDELHKPWLQGANICLSRQNVINHLKVKAPSYIDLSAIDKPYFVPQCEDIDNGYLFNPTRVNTLIQHSLLGDWNFEVTEYSKEQRANEGTEAIRNSQSFDRQDRVIAQLETLNSLENFLIDDENKKLPQVESIKPPLIIVLPFTSSDIRRQYIGNLPSKASPDHKIMEKALKYVLSQETMSNYTTTVKATSEKMMIATGIFTQLIYGYRSNFEDMTGMLHCSVKGSPYLRLPHQGVEINRELSWFAPKASSALCTAKGLRGLENLIMDLGGKIAKKSLSPKANRYLSAHPRQVVAISDLPVEWLPVNGVPLGFSHDVCRIPEMPLEHQLMHYVIQIASKFFVVPEDIMSKTLVVYGCRDDSFKYYQEKCDELSKLLGFKTKTCLSKEDFFRSVGNEDCQFLIVDTHGGFDETCNQTYMLMDDEKVYPQDIVDNGVHVPLVFLSACTTAPTYNAVNTLANGFFEAGSMAVTSSYLPLEVDKSSMIYLRILRQLAEAAKGPIHKNWLSFISHILRTSYIHDASLHYYLDNDKETAEIAENGIVTNMLTESMVFPLRSALFKQLKNGFEADGIRITTDGIVPHYLLYSTIGRVDLINFSSWLKAHIKNIGETGNEKRE